MDEDGTVVVKRTYAEVVLYRGVVVTQGSFDGEAVNLHSVTLCGFPFGKESPLAYLPLDRAEDKGRWHIVRIDLHREVNMVHVDALNRFAEGERDILVGVKCVARLKFLCQEHFLEGVLLEGQWLLGALGAFLTFLLPFFHVLQPFLFLLGMCGLCHQLQSVGAQSVYAQCVSLGIGEGKGNGVGVGNQCVCNPIGDGVVVERRFGDEHLCRVEAYSLDLWQRIQRGSEEKGKRIGGLALSFQEMLFLSAFDEGPQDKVVGIVVYEGHHANLLYRAIGIPNGVGAYVGALSSKD